MSAPLVTLERAQAFLARGLSVIPVPRPRPGVPMDQPGGGKVPAIAWKEFQTRLPTDAELVRWFSGDDNIAIITGALSGVVVIDADSPPALKWCAARLSYTPWQTRTARGYQFFYHHPGVPVGNRAKIDTGDGKLDLDARGDGGFVIAPGSLHASGHVYKFAGDWTVDRSALPQFWPGWLQKPTPISTPRRVGPRPTGDIIERARRYLKAIPVPVIGAGSDQAVLYAACRLVRGFELSSSDAESLLWEWCGGRPGWTSDWVAEKVENAAKYGDEAIGALR
jgi:hypothetical protein